MQFTPGAHTLDNHHCLFRVWALHASSVELKIVNPKERLIPLRDSEHGYFQADVEDVSPGTLYFYRLDHSKERPDPASRFQPRGVHGPSQVVGGFFEWDDSYWFGIPLQDYVIYELHVGTFTSQGTFEAIVAYLPELRELGVTAIELMPVAQFPGGRNWGYDGVFPFAVQDSYGGPERLKRLINACHQEGLAAILDVVYNHLGPEGNYFSDFAPYFTERYKTPWGLALNFDGPDSDQVRLFFIENALYWITEFHFDALRLDAVHAILDHSSYTFLEELCDAVRERANKLNRHVFVFPESPANDSRLVRARDLGGYGFSALWNDDFHHALHGLLTGEKHGYYEDYGEFRQLLKAYREGFVYSGEHSRFRRRRHGTSSRDIPAERFVVFAQNHDQVGNRVQGERLTQMVSFEELKLAAGAVLLSPFIPLVFMGEEYGEPAPFQYFISHGDINLVEAVRKGRRAEFTAFTWQIEPPDPQDEATFLRAKLNHNLRHTGQHRILWEFYQKLLCLRKRLVPLTQLSKKQCEVVSLEEQRVILLRRWSGEDQALGMFNYNVAPVSVAASIPRGDWQKVLDSADQRWLGSGSALPETMSSEEHVMISMKSRSFALFVRRTEARNR
ncbi:MAG TPA: malto-oligosyltrehalose trehalohydrolase [Methylomirabilota bacterium]|nr:malto-oligosyltrehalose trehalohydrolase [Methylomirabilota bacterium]